MTVRNRSFSSRYSDRISLTTIIKLPFQHPPALQKQPENPLTYLIPLENQRLLKIRDNPHNPARIRDSDNYPTSPIILAFSSSYCRIHGCQQLLTELCGKNTVDVRLHHAALLIRRHRRRVFIKPVPDEVRLDTRRGNLNEFRLRMDDLTDNGISLDFELCCIKSSSSFSLTFWARI